MESFWKRAPSFLVFVALLSLAASFRFTNSPPANVVLLKGQSFWFSWQFELEGDALLQYECYFKNKTDSVEKVAEGSTRFIIVSRNPKFVAYSDNKTIAVMNVDYQEIGTYYCQVYRRGFADPTNSTETSLSVEGQPEFCVGTPTPLVRVKENEEAPVNIAICGVPTPSFFYKWENEGLKSVTVSPVGGLLYQYSAVIKLGSLQRDRCNKSIVYYGENSRGKTVEQQIKFVVSFKPNEPQNFGAFYVNDGFGVKANWEKQESGSCLIKYDVTFLSYNNATVGMQSGFDIYTASITLNSTNVTSVILTASTSEGSTSKSYQVSAGPPPTEAPKPGVGGGSKDNSVWIIVGCVIGGIFLVAIIVVAIICGKKTGCGKIGGPQDDRRDHPDSYGSGQRPNKSEYAQVGFKQDPQINANTPKGGVVYGELGAGGGRTGPRATKPLESDYADIKLTAEGYPASGPTTSPYGQATISDEAIV